VNQKPIRDELLDPEDYLYNVEKYLEAVPDADVRGRVAYSLADIVRVLADVIAEKDDWSQSSYHLLLPKSRPSLQHQVLLSVEREKLTF